MEKIQKEVLLPNSPSVYGKLSHWHSPPVQIAESSELVGEVEDFTSLEREYAEDDLVYQAKIKVSISINLLHDDIVWHHSAVYTVQYLLNVLASWHNIAVVLPMNVLPHSQSSTTAIIACNNALFVLQVTIGMEEDWVQGYGHVCSSLFSIVEFLTKFESWGPYQFKPWPTVCCVYLLVLFPGPGPVFCYLQY